jgi:uncharacterized protein Smg (DUF494 family)
MDSYTCCVSDVLRFSHRSITDYLQLQPVRDGPNCDMTYEHIVSLRLNEIDLENTRLLIILHYFTIIRGYFA